MLGKRIVGDLSNSRGFLVAPSSGYPPCHPGLNVRPSSVATLLSDHPDPLSQKPSLEPSQSRLRQPPAFPGLATILECGGERGWNHLFPIAPAPISTPSETVVSARHMMWAGSSGIVLTRCRRTRPRNFPPIREMTAEFMRRSRHPKPNSSRRGEFPLCAVDHDTSQSSATAAQNSCALAHHPVLRTDGTRPPGHELRQGRTTHWRQVRAIR